MPYSYRSVGEKLFDRCYRRLGRGYLPTLLLATALGVVLITMPVENLTQVPLWTGRGFDRWPYVLVFMAAAAAGSVVLGPVVWWRHRPLFRFARGEAVDAADVWRAAVTKIPLTSAIVTTAWGAIIITTGVGWVGRHEEFSPSLYAAATAAQIMLMIGAGAFFFLIYELAFLPFARRVAPQLPVDFVGSTGLTVRRRLLLVTAAMAFTIGSAAAGLAVAFPDREARIWAVVLGTVGLVTTFLGVLLALLQFGLTRRVTELAQALGSVGRGRALQRVYPSYGDEFDDVGHALNRTVELLSEHARDLQASRARLVAVADETRRRAERDLHDGAQQHVAMVSVQLALLERKASRPEAVAALAAVREELGTALNELRTLAHGIYPVALEHEGLMAALSAAGRQAGVRVVVDAATDLPRWSREAEVALYFCCWELIQSLTAPSEAPVRLALGEQAGWGSFYVSAPVHAADDATALFLKDRIGAVGGEVSVTQTADGIVAHGTVPLS